MDVVRYMLKKVYELQFVTSYEMDDGDPQKKKEYQTKSNISYKFEWPGFTFTMLRLPQVANTVMTRGICYELNVIWKQYGTLC